MTTDPFTETANAAAREYAQTPRMNVGTVRDRIGEAHADGWQAARAHLAAQEPTDAEVRAALGAANRTTFNGQRFDAPLSFYADNVVEAIRAALTAARRAETTRASCGCDLTGPVPPAVHIVDGHEEDR